MAKLYDLVFTLLTDHKQLRNSDKKLIWSVWYKLDFVRDGVITKESFMNDKCPTPEAITRCRRKIQETHKELQADEPIEEARRKKAQEKGNHIFREQVDSPLQIEPNKGHWEYEGDRAIWVEN